MTCGPVSKYLEYIRNDYRNWNKPRGGDNTVRNEMVAEFEAGVRYEIGKKYIKVITGGSVHSFIVFRDDGKFKKGDILKAASWAAPAKNFARGNLFEGTFDRVRWTGVI
jgi:hypothetical protein